MLASAVRYAEDLMEDDRIKLGDLSMLRIQKIEMIDGFVSLALCFDGDDRQSVVARLSLAPRLLVKAYNQ